MQTTVGLNDVFSIAPILILFLTSLVPLTIKLIRNRIEQPMPLTVAQALCGTAVAAAWIALGPQVTAAPIFGGALVVDGLARIANLIILMSAAMAIVLAHGNINTRGGQFSEMTFLILNSAVGMMVLNAATDLIVVFIGLEIMSLAIYCLVAMSHEQTLSKEAAFKYFILGSFASAIFLYGVALMFGAVGSTKLWALKEAGEGILENRLFVVGWILLLVGYCFKVSIFPFHFWTPDVYQGASTPMTAFMSTGVKVAAFVSLLRVMLARGLWDASPVLDVLQWLAVATMLVGNIGAIMQDNIKRMLAYSSVAHSGYLMIGLIVAGVSGSEGAFGGGSAILFYLLTYTFMNIGALGFVSIFEKYEETSLSVEDLKGMAFKHPWLALGLTICLVSLAGIPPTAGFFGKFFIFSAAVGEGFYWLTVWGVISSVISVYFYLRPIVVMYMKEGLAAPIVERDLLGRFAILGSAAAVILIGLAASPFFHMIQTSMLSLLN